MQEQNKISQIEFKLFSQSPSILPPDLGSQQLSTAIQNFLSKEASSEIKDPTSCRYIIVPSSSQSKTIQLYIRSQRKDCLLVQFFVTDTISVVKERLAYYLSMEPQNILLVSKGIRIDDNEYAELGELVKDGQFLYVVDREGLQYRKGRIVVEKTFESLAKTITVSNDNTLSELYTKVEYQTQVNRNCFNLFYLGAFLDSQSKLSLKQALVTDGCEMKTTVNQKKLLMVQSLAQLLSEITISTGDIRECGSIEQILQNQSLLTTIISYLKTVANKIAGSKSIQDRFSLNDAFDREIAQLYNQYDQLLVKGAAQLLLQNIESSKLFVLCVAFSLLKIQRDFHIEVFLLDCVLFNRQRKLFFFQRLDNILKKQATSDQKVNDIAEIVDWLSNKANFARIDRLSGYQISVLNPKIRILIETLYQSSDSSSVNEYINLLETNSYTLDGLLDILSIEKGYILINLKLLDEISSHYDLFAQISILYYLLALYFPLFKCPTEEKENLQINIKQNMNNMQNEEFVSSLAQLLFKEDLDLDDY